MIYTNRVKYILAAQAQYIFVGGHNMVRWDQYNTSADKNSMTDQLVL